jgi:hypothetical protein
MTVIEGSFQYRFNQRVEVVLKWSLRRPHILSAETPNILLMPPHLIHAANTARNTLLLPSAVLLLLPRTLPALENTPARSNTYSSSSQLARPARLPVLTARSQADPALETDVTETVLSS